MKAVKAKTTNSSSQQTEKHSFFGKADHAVAEPSMFFGPSRKGNFFSPSVVQPKLTVGKPNDPYEKEADSMADKVVQRLSEQSPDVQKKETPFMNSASTLLQAKCTECEQEEKLQKKDEKLSAPEKILKKSIFESNEEKSIQRKPEGISPLQKTADQSASKGSLVVQTKCMECEQEEKLQKKDEKLSAPEKILKKSIFESNEEKTVQRRPEGIQTQKNAIVSSGNDSSVIQAKCTECEQEEKLLKKDETELSPEKIFKTPVSAINEENITQAGFKPLNSAGKKFSSPHALSSLIQTKCNDCEQEEKLQKKESVGQPIEIIQPKPLAEPKEIRKVQLKSEPAGPLPAKSITPVPASVPAVQPKCASCEQEEKQSEKDEEGDGELMTKIQKQPVFDTNSRRDDQVIQRECRECEEGSEVLLKPEAIVQRDALPSQVEGNGSRESIVAAAKGELGKVQARLNDGTGKRVGSERLLEYFHIAAPDVWDDSIIETHGAKMPSWCGIFSVWAHKKAGKDIGNWQMGKGVSEFGTLTVTDSPQPGDIGYIHKPNQHHCIVERVEGDNIHSIDGNSGLNSEVIENTRPKSKYDLFLTAFGGAVSNTVQTKEEENSGLVQTKSGDTASTASVEQQLNASKGNGQSLDDSARSGMEQSFGADFSNVKIHTDSNAVQMSKNLHAQAFTHGSDIYFNSGKFDTGSSRGQHLLAHELTHVVQQGSAPESQINKSAAAGAPEILNAFEEKKRSLQTGGLEEEMIIRKPIFESEESLPFKEEVHFPEKESVTQIQKQTNGEHIQLQPQPSALARLDSALNQIDVPEGQVIVLCGQLTAVEKTTVLARGYKERMAAALDVDEMRRAVNNLGPVLRVKLEWINAAATFGTSSISYSQINTLVTSAPQAERNELKTNSWRSFFVDVCDNSTIIQAVRDLGFDLKTKLEWIKEEATFASWAFSYRDIKQFVIAAPQPERDQLKTDEWKTFFVDICDNPAMIEAVRDLNFDLLTKLQWIRAEATFTSWAFSYSDVKEFVIAAPQAERDLLKTDEWKTFFVDICDNPAMIEAVRDLNFDFLTKLQWIRAEGTSTYAYSDIKEFIIGATQADRDQLKNDDWRGFFIDVCDNTTIIEAVRDLGFDLVTKLQWIRAEATFTSWAFSYSDIKEFITGATQVDRDQLKTDYWRGFFVDVCDNTTIIEAVRDLGFDLVTKLQWIRAEATFTSWAFSYSDVKEFVIAAPQPERDLLKTNEWKIFFVDICDNTTIVEAVIDLNFDLRTKIEWIIAEGIGGEAIAHIAAQPGGDILVAMDAMDDATLAVIRGTSELIDALQLVMNNQEFARFAALLIVTAPATLVRRADARNAALGIITVQLNNKDIARSTINSNLRVILIPQNLLLTDVAEFSSLAGKTTFDGRPWERVRGVRHENYVAFAEENLLGGACTAIYNGTPLGTRQPVGYSSATHEFAHGLHVHILSDADKQIITNAFNARTTLATASPADPNQWVDGRQGCYASQNEREFFAQLSNAYLGTNMGIDSVTRDPRHNGKAWVQANEPTVYTVLDRMYSGGSVAGANP